MLEETVELETVAMEVDPRYIPPPFSALLEQISELETVAVEVESRYIPPPSCVAHACNMCFG